MPFSSLSRSFAIFLLANALSQNQVDSVFCGGGEDPKDPSQSCGGLVNSCTSSGLCVVGTDGNCCASFTDTNDETDKSTCTPKDLVGFPYTTDCPSGVVAIESIGGDGTDTMVGITAFCSGEKDKSNFANSCGGLVDTCTTEGLCVVNQEGLCCSVYTDSDKEKGVKAKTDCIPEGEYTNQCPKGGVAIASETTAPTNTPTMEPTGTPTKVPTKTPTNSPTMEPTDAPTTAPTKAPTKMPTQSPTPEESGCGRNDASSFVLGLFISFVFAFKAF